MRYKFIARSNPSNDRIDDYNKWYDEQHLPDMLKIPGFVSAERFICVGESTHQFLTILEIETTDLQAAMAEVERRSGTELMPISDALDFETVDVTLWEPYRAKG